MFFFSFFLFSLLGSIEQHSSNDEGVVLKKIRFFFSFSFCGLLHVCNKEFFVCETVCKCLGGWVGGWWVGLCGIDYAYIRLKKMCMMHLHVGSTMRK